MTPHYITLTTKGILESFEYSQLVHHIFKEAEMRETKVKLSLSEKNHWRYGHFIFNF
jgi:hypothetical protein